ncbi:MAG: excinuclease ABC subunit UvrC [Limnochordia bacterium]|jgi:excinuclease ABC subunit C|nr:excinuclease ABC subunit UvrC [Limnochordia bacterium]MDI9465530.1 excinuclease ABC subunit UvrC [Bacillota bacterium]NLO96268.1 excinuclease ABC subunit UvrC [Bacillota bacterium]HOB40344.1 excinuclease ABC subunit UvrC [Limnochordia bacterium]HOK31486.1 excinuclease ABC subunit UvrC [Limnochordia bacterium]
MDLQEKLSMLPTAPGVYLMKNEAGEVIYVGKAVSLRSRVRSYFQKSAAHPLKVQVMVEHIHDFEYIVTDSEVEALILENHLIKEYAPRYNVRLKDDKTYPYIKVTVQEDFPRVLMVRRRLDDGARYFGPYTDVSAVKKTLSFLRTLFPVRTCSKKIVEGQQDRPCLNYHIGRCLGPCAGLVSGEKYREMIEEVIMFLEGRIDRLLPELTEKMQQAAAKLEFEKAARFRNQIRGLQALAERQKMVAQHHEDQDYVGYARWGELACVQVFFVRGGKLVGRDHFLLDCSSEEDAQEILRSFLQQYYQEASFIPREVLIPVELQEPAVLESWLGRLRGGRVYLRTPRRGAKRQLLDLVMKNAQLVLDETKSRQSVKEKAVERALQELQEVADLPEPPERIEAFDISNLQGTNIVASLVVWENGDFKSSDYRRFRIRGVAGAPDDYASMREAVGRRFRRGLQEKEEEGGEGKFSLFPDLVLIDGGKGQLSAALEVRDELGLIMPFIALAEKREEIYLEGRSEPVVLPLDSPGLLLLRRIRDEAHRFALTYHRNLRGRATRSSILDEIPGIGPKRKKDLLRHFGTVKRIREASLEELQQVPGISAKLAAEIYQYMHKGALQNYSIE